jgi:hypothetical protein
MRSASSRPLASANPSALRMRRFATASKRQQLEPVVEHDAPQQRLDN